MFEVREDAALTEPPWGPPPVPEDLVDERMPSEEDELANAAELAALSPEERFEREFGYPAAPEELSLFANSTEEAAAFAQELAAQAAQVRTIAEAHRVCALLRAYEISMDDLRVRFGPAFGSRVGLGAASFFKSFGLQSGTHPLQVASDVDAALILRDRLPQTWAVFQQGRASWSRIRTVIRQADGLDTHCWPTFDSTAARLVISSTRLKDDLRKARERLQDDTAAARARATHERRRTSIEPLPDGGAAFVAEGTAASWVPINDALHRAAVAAHGAEGETRSVATLRHDIALDILHEGLQRCASTGDRVRVRVPQRRPVAVSLVLTVPALAWLGRSKEQAQLSGYGPIDLETAKGLAGSAKSFLRVLTDPFTGARLAMDRNCYAPPADLARWVRLRDGRSRFPGSPTPAHLSDVDHAREWHAGGPTNDVNLITLDRPNHNAKSAGLWQEELLDTGTVGWDDVWGHRFEDPPSDPLDPAPPGLLPTSPPSGDGTSTR